MAVSVADIASMEAQITERIREYVPGLLVERVRSLQPSEYQLKAAEGVALVMYGGARYGFPDSAARKQRRDPSMLVLVAGRNLGAEDAHQGVYESLERIREALTGFEVVVPGKLRLEFYPSEERPVAEREGVFWYQLTVTGIDTYHRTS